MLAQFITNGQLNRQALATAVLGGAEFTAKYGAYMGVNSAALENNTYMNIFGRLPTAAERALLFPFSLVDTVVAVAELGRTSGQVIRSDVHDGVSTGTATYADSATP